MLTLALAKVMFFLSGFTFRSFVSYMWLLYLVLTTKNFFCHHISYTPYLLCCMCKNIENHFFHFTHLCATGVGSPYGLNSGNPGICNRSSYIYRQCFFYHELYSKLMLYMYNYNHKFILVYYDI